MFPNLELVTLLSTRHLPEKPGNPRSGYLSSLDHHSGLELGGTTLSWFRFCLKSRFQSIVLMDSYSNPLACGLWGSADFHFVTHAFQHLHKASRRDHPKIWFVARWVGKSPICGWYSAPWTCAWRQSCYGWALANWNEKTEVSQVRGRLDPENGIFPVLDGVALLLKEQVYSL